MQNQHGRDKTQQNADRDAELVDSHDVREASEDEEEDEWLLSLEEADEADDVGRGCC